MTASCVCEELPEPISTEEADGNKLTNLCVLVGTGPSSPSRLAGDVGAEGQGGPYSLGLGLSGVLRGVQSSAGGLGRRVR